MDMCDFVSLVIRSIKTMTLNELKTKAEPILTDFWQTLRAHEDAYFAKHGHYFQLLSSNKVVDGVDTDLVLRVPSDAQYTMDTLQSYSSKVPFQIRVDTYDGPEGNGYVARIEAFINEKTYRRERDSNNVDSGWYLYTPFTPII
jgi:hypothetical protein